ncbi:MAG: hypothetical protein KDK36_02225, partial [Leptospiraceae bacterium]|nr:hypothetical protein [Leptospiraceae bacterium]
LHNSLYEGQKALILYHNGGLSLFGIYEITKSGEKQIIKTICRDTYHVGGMPDDEKTSINLDKLSSNDKYAISCSSLYRKTISQEKK